MELRCYTVNNIWEFSDENNNISPVTVCVCAIELLWARRDLVRSSPHIPIVLGTHL